MGRTGEDRGGTEWSVGPLLTALPVGRRPANIRDVCRERIQGRQVGPMGGRTRPVVPAVQFSHLMGRALRDSAHYQSFRGCSAKGESWLFFQLSRRIKRITSLFRSDPPSWSGLFLGIGYDCMMFIVINASFDVALEGRVQGVVLVPSGLRCRVGPDIYRYQTSFLSQVGSAKRLVP